MNIKEQIPSVLNSPDMQMTAFDPGLGYWEMAIGILVYSVLIYLLTNWLFNKRDVALLRKRVKVLDKSSFHSFFCVFLVK